MCLCNFGLFTKQRGGNFFCSSLMGIDRINACYGRHSSVARILFGCLKGRDFLTVLFDQRHIFAVRSGDQQLSFGFFLRLGQVMEILASSLSELMVDSLGGVDRETDR